MDKQPKFSKPVYQVAIILGGGIAGAVFSSEIWSAGLKHSSLSQNILVGFFLASFEKSNLGTFTLFLVSSITVLFNLLSNIMS